MNFERTLNDQTTFPVKISHRYQFNKFKKIGISYFGTRLKVLKALFCIIKTFDLVFKVVGTDFGTGSKVLIMVFLA
jgi:putative transposon-encoded protein